MSFGSKNEKNSNSHNLSRKFRRKDWNKLVMLENVENTVQFVNEKKKISSDASVIGIIYTAFEVNIVF